MSKKIISIIVVIVILVGGYFLFRSMNDDEVILYNDGIFRGEADNGDYTAIAEVTIEDKEIIKIVIDDIDASGESKREKSISGAYVMAGEAYPWHKQMDDFSDRIIKKQGVSDFEFLDEKIDSITSVTVAVEPHSVAVDRALKQSVTGETTTKYMDGIHKSVIDNGEYTATVELTIKDDKIVKIVTDDLDADGKSKREQSMSGEYMMDGDGAKWHEQMDAFGDEIINKQGVTDFKFTDGKIDSLDSVTMAVEKHSKAVEQALKDALR